MTHLVINGLDLIYRKRRDIWVACLGPGYFVHFVHPPGAHWKAHLPLGLEPIAVSSSLHDCVIAAQQHYERRQQERKAQVRVILYDAYHAT
jgi:hypothetical protein